MTALALALAACRPTASPTAPPVALLHETPSAPEIEAPEEPQSWVWLQPPPRDHWPSSPVVHEPRLRAPRSATRALADTRPRRACDRPVEDALEWLARHQKRDGSWCVATDCCRADKERASGDVDVGISALATLAFVRGGHARGIAVRRAVAWLVSRQAEDGCVGARGPKHMYGHLIAAAALAEASARCSSLLIRDPAERALAFTLAAQNPGKGWRYASRPGDNDSSVTGWAVLSLLSVPPSAYDGAIAWFDKATDKNYFITGYDGLRGCRLGLGTHDPFNAHNTPTAIAIFVRRSLDRSDPRAKSGFP